MAADVATLRSELAVALCCFRVSGFGLIPGLRVQGAELRVLGCGYFGSVGF